MRTRCHLILTWELMENLSREVPFVMESQIVRIWAEGRGKGCFSSGSVGRGLLPKDSKAHTVKSLI